MRGKLRNWSKYVMYVLVIFHCAVGLSVWFARLSTSEKQQRLVRNGVRVISDHTEQMMIGLFAMLLGIALIVVLWNGIFWGMKHERTKCILIVCTSVVIGILVTPLNYTLETDNAELYVAATRGCVEYWHGFYQSVLYQACMIVLYHPMTITILQCAGFLSVITYLAMRIRTNFGRHWDKLIWLVLLFPSTFEIMVNPYRNNINTIICVFFLGSVLLDCVEQRNRSFSYHLLLGAILGLMVAYRMENVSLGLVYLYVIIRNYSRQVKKIACALGLCVIVFVVANIPQKLGDMKYYGKDYMIVNQMNTLQYIMQQPGVNSTYEGAQEDILTIHEFANLQGILGGGLDGYRARRYAVIGDANQSLKSDAEQNRFLRACYRLYWNNPSVYLKERYETFLESNAFGMRGKYADEETSAFYNQVTTMFLHNYDVVERDSKRIEGMRFRGFNLCAFYFFNACKGFSDILYEQSIWPAMRVLNYGFFFICFVVGVVRLDKNKILLCSFFLSCIMNMISVFLFEPEGRMVYFTPVSYLIALFNFVVILEIIKQKHNMKYIDEK